jgi:hypothetical protein
MQALIPNPISMVWDRFCSGLSQAGRDVLSAPYDAGGLDQVDGYHHIAQLLEQALHWQLWADADFPRFVTLNDTFEFADNRLAPVRAGASYRVTGNVSTLFDFNISLQEGWPFVGKPGTWGDLGRSDLEMAPDGSFELIISHDRCEGNWLPLPPEASMLHIREYFHDWERHSPGSFEIERLGSSGEAPPRMDPAQLSQRLDSVIDWIRGYTPTHFKMISRLRAGPANVLQPAIRHGAGNSNIAYSFGRFDLPADQCLLLEFPEPKTRLWGLQWLTTPWYENPDIANRATSVGGKQVFLNTDGKVRIAVCGADPGIPNWLDTTGYHEGILIARWIWLDGEAPAVTPKVVGLQSIRESVPADTPQIARGERADQQVRRRAHFALRRR